ncbi:hypothetical protein BX616_010011 [Lobosporangium transversale]|uniref:Transmembrane protein 135 N-terminal domain-containing protein n=1 Tax=Lobosporangium transversale TaxID=64571 RepID=A0A1Y2GUA9_9FUNG|nr:hypothetical protein BCR41DRAFT_333798 [Lobosporangium transversale]KAF9913461.1 hypothetical protein BX616_010011 [Lobosporangium transversale]ORZ23808.1 hypothetical protein BCR41DRAFT_333798 [Lobosporangium transversale]|eukprot:XP_021883622.1 hypothetical protein BCR41DRAFT_333798 [Lobosporangium transversale]
MTIHNTNIPNRDSGDTNGQPQRNNMKNTSMSEATFANAALTSNPQDSKEASTTKSSFPMTLSSSYSSLSSDPLSSSIGSPFSNRSRKLPRHDDRANWVNGKRPKGYRTPEGREAAEKSKKFKSGTTIPHLVYSCNTYEGVLKHALLGAIRSGGVSYGAKALVNLCLGMLKVMNGKTSFAKVFKDAFVGADAMRFGAFFGAFSFLWKFVNNGLKLYRGTDDRINGAIAGAIAGLAILIENHERRVTFAQQMFMRSIQGIYNAGKHRGQLSLRHGDALLFAIGSAQIMYAYTMHPDTIPKEFLGFMIKTARVPAESLAFNRLNVRGFPLDLKQARALIDRHRPTARAIQTMSTMTENVSVIPCELLHPWVDSCKQTNTERFAQVTKEIFPVYATLNFVPLLVLRMKRLLKDPAKVISKTTFNALRSSVFLAIFVAGYQTQICTHRNLLKAGWPLGNSKYLYWLFGLVCAGVSIMVEQESRRSELAMYVLPKAATSLYKILYRKNWVKGVKYWEVMTFSFAMSLIMSFYQQEEQVLSPFVTRLIYHVLGRS